jgi:ribonuclease Z
MCGTSRRRGDHRVRELIVLGTSAQVPTRHRNANGYLLRWDEEVLLLDPGEGTQRQMTLAGVSSSALTRILITHFHGDHCLGLPGVVQRLSLDRVAHPVQVWFPASGGDYIDHLLHASVFHRTAELVLHPAEAGVVDAGPPFALVAARLDHGTDTLGWRLEEPEGRRMLPARLAALGIAGEAVGRLQREGAIEAGGRRITMEEASEPRPGQRFAFVMDTRLCDAAYALAEGADMLVCESTFSSADEGLAREYGHLTAAQAARIAAESGVRLLVLTHFSQRYQDASVLLDEARDVFSDSVVARDLARIPVPRRPPTA